MSSGQIFVTFVLPAMVFGLCYGAVVLNERAVKRATEREHRMPGG
ncbi:hypothetical protein [Methylorubrum salsuginis]|uniref:Uncharacterized protein n=1 Tax=Methylorubrum salsuginis TaxID=414703 RepID=A0A1I4G254_9HYPH|nr:hypothetical protein [Methylorubrum salsuginis]SFL23156.1 hypothetical protein SAMN04488125_11119 [Methylorubrum salsuginis]